MNIYKKIKMHEFKFKNNVNTKNNYFMYDYTYNVFALKFYAGKRTNYL